MNKIASLTPQQQDIILHKATEFQFSGKYTNTEINGTYLCRNCGLALFRANNKFHSSCGWPSFDADIKGTVTQLPDADKQRTEIICTRCQGHLGHIFYGEGLTNLNTRYCVNSASLDFVTDTQVKDTKEIILAGGCFWGVEYNLQKLNGVVLTQVGYCGGLSEEPTYKEVCTGKTQHIEAVRVIFDNDNLTLETLLQYFFKIHNPTQANGQGVDIGTQYHSAIFCYNQQQKDLARKVINLMPNANNILTTVRNMATFWQAEEYHQDYCNKNNNTHI